MSEAIQKFVFADANEVRVVMRNNEPWFIAKDVCDILGTRSDTVRQIAGNKRVMSINPNSIGDNGRGHGKDILIVNGDAEGDGQGLRRERSNRQQAHQGCFAKW